MSDREVHEAMVHQAACRVPNVYSSTYFSRSNISILDQQSRCFNLCWSLAKLKRIKRWHHVAIVGGGISGMTCATALAVWTDCMVSVLESDPVQLRRFRQAAYRYIHPDLNHRGYESGNFVEDLNKPTRFPFMNWSGNYAPTFAEELISKFDHYRSALNIALYLSTTVNKFSGVDGRVELEVLHGQQQRKMTFDAVILATGYGPEKRDSEMHTKDRSYWLSGNPISYLASPQRRGEPERVLVSGNGDSAVIELAHYLIRDFDHERIFSFLPNDALTSKFTGNYAKGIRALAHRQIEREDGGPLQWFKNQRAAHAKGGKPSFLSIRGFNLRRELYKAGLSAEGTADFEKKLRNDFTNLASEEISRYLNGYNLSKLFPRTIRAQFRDDVEVVITGDTSTLYSVGQAPLNWFLLRLLSHYAPLTYRRTRLARTRLHENLIGCEFQDRPVNGTFHRVIARHGPEYSGLAMDSPRTTERKPSGYIPMPERFYSWVTDHEGYRTKRLLNAQRRRLPLMDEPDSGSMAEPKFFLRQADAALWVSSGTALEADMRVLYRLLKRGRNWDERKAALTELAGALKIIKKQKTP